MDTEIELKFFVSSDFSHRIRDKIVGVKQLQQSQRELGNIYFDTPDFTLRKHDIGLRVRRFDGVYIQTLKTAGRVVAGLHQRPEYNAELNGPEPDLSLIPVEAWPDGLDIQALASQLQPLFSTDFVRRQWLLATEDGSQIELACDQGEVSTDAGDKDVISEVELELISGQTDALFSLARNLADEGGVRLGNLSKAARGYRLATGYQGDPVTALSIVKLRDDDCQEKALIRILEHALSHWHYHEQIYIERESLDALQEIRYAVLLIRQSLALFGSVVPRRASTLLRQELQWFEGELAWLDHATAIARLCEDKGQYLRKLNARKPLVKALKDKHETLPEREDVVALLHASRYCNLLLDLSRWILSKGWQPFLDDKAEEKLAQPIQHFADKALPDSWQELLAVFDETKTLTRHDYFDQYPRLQRNLLLGTCLASLFDKSRRKAFRLPWLDMLQGIEELRLLEPVRELVAELDDDEDKKQAEKWLARKEESLLHAMTQSRQTGLTLTPYWQD
ncbi:CYTH and CHAD domain-containing protein [Salinivibrio proteolyticus]|jgi:triphosphatase|uniref:Inorganic triphosphatase n=1 Tax=Salinivibrio proteolyticus TaxID=334715 RepID=A0ABY7LDU5_9GAMM|nr:inorganic triphosphatase [Salinivibrio proteolyticus]WBA14441.1 inorganic triphosphatase [Salinivibrio proteolyticus]